MRTEILTPFERDVKMQSDFVRADAERDMWEKNHIHEAFLDGKFWRVPRVAGGMPNQTTVWQEPIWFNKADGPQVVSVAVETQLIALLGEQPVLKGMFTDQSSQGRTVNVFARGVMQTTGTPTFTWFGRMGTTPNVITGTSVATSPGITTASGAPAGTLWEQSWIINCTTPGIGGGNCTLTIGGNVVSPAGFASPFMYGLYVGGAVTATWTTTIDGSVNQYLMLSLNPGTSSASNNATLKHCLVWATTN